MAAPFLSSLNRTAHGQEAADPRRLVIFYTQNGCLTNRWFPTVEDGAITADSLTGTTLAGLAPVADKLSSRGAWLCTRPIFAVRTWILATRP